MIEYRAVFRYPAPWQGEGAYTIGYGPARETRAEAMLDRPWRPEESHGRQVGIQTRTVSDWADEDATGPRFEGTVPRD